MQTADDPQPRAARGPNLHRKNAAEWVMWFCLLPAFAAVWTFDRLRRTALRRWNQG